MNTVPKIFISYCWTPLTHKEWILDFAERLTRDGVHVIIDEWDTTEGQDKYQFMEKMVNDVSVKRVLLICNKDYAEKANSKKGGVGIESQIISSEIYSQVDQKKFIPIVREFYDNGKACLPTFVSSRFYCDLSDGDYYEENYEILIRNIFEKPKHKRPPIGESPAYIKENEPTYLRTAHKFRPLKESIISGKNNVSGLLREYFELFNLTLNDFLLPNDVEKYDPPLDETLIEKFEQLKNLKNEYVDIISLYTKYLPIDNDLVFGVLENAYNVVNQNNLQCKDHLQLLLNELFLYTMAILIKSKHFSTVLFLLSNMYAVERNDGITYESFSIFNRYNRVFDQDRNSRLNLNRVSVSADLILARATNHMIPFNELCEVDLLLHYCSILFFPKSMMGWFPRLSCYTYRAGIPKIIQKMKSKRYFDKVKIVFDVKDKIELFSKIKGVAPNIYHGYSTINFQFHNIFSAFDENEIAMID